MREELPLISYERSMNHNYLVLGKCDFFGTADGGSKNYRVRMLLENKIQGLLPVTLRQINGEHKYYYEINSLQSLDRLIEKSELKYRELRALFLGCVTIFDRLEEYLLSGEQLIIQPDFIYVNVESMEPYFVCYPDYTGDVRVSFVEFVDALLTRIDHTDEQAVMLGYQVYRYTRNPNYVLSEIRKFTECPMEHVSEESSYRNLTHHNETSNEFCFSPENPIAEVSDSGKKNNRNNNRKNESLEQCYNSSVMENYELYRDDDNDDFQNKKGDKKQLIGGIFCIFTALCAGTIIVCARTLKLFALSGDNELYMYGAIAMALVAAALFFISYIKTVRQENEIAQLNEEEEDELYAELMKRDIVNNETKKEMPCMNSNYKKGTVSLGTASETVCLEGAVIEERVLRGKINGTEVNVPLDHLPLTVGKLGGVSDFIINDTTVSKMHARFEEHNGKVCVCDLNSTNGTVHNGEVIAMNTPVALEPGDQLRFGRSCFTYL